MHSSQRRGKDVNRASGLRLKLSEASSRGPCQSPRDRPSFLKLPIHIYTSPHSISSSDFQKAQERCNSTRLSIVALSYPALSRCESCQRAPPFAIVVDSLGGTNSSDFWGPVRSSMAAAQQISALFARYLKVNSRSIFEQVVSIFSSLKLIFVKTISNPALQAINFVLHLLCQTPSSSKAYTVLAVLLYSLLSSL